MLKRILFFFLIAILPGIAGFQVYAQKKVTIKLASLVPENTPWGASLNRMAVEWAQASNGEVELIIFHGGIAGDEDAVMRKLKQNQIQAALFTSAGFSLISPEIMTLSYPLLIHNNEELDAVLARIKPEMEKKIQEKDFITLAWARAGWIKIFSKTPVMTPADLRKLKLGCNPDDLKMMQAFRAMGYQMIPVGLTDVLVSLKSNMIDAVYMSPVAVAAGQLFTLAPNMSSLNLAPFMGGIVVHKRTWNSIPEKHRPALLAICKKVENEVDNSFAALEAEAIRVMTRNGLTINTLSRSQEQVWIKDMENYESRLVGQIFNNDMYRRISNILTAYRAGK
jgi:TRAP-type C4-dicarboxylate transport system substrate-binding protein